ncbi:MAG: hypothetical protein ACK5XN_22465, partial [Bacteroidota bacterium]
MSWFFELYLLNEFVQNMQSYVVKYVNAAQKIHVGRRHRWNCLTHTRWPLDRSPIDTVAPNGSHALPIGQES